MKKYINRNFFWADLLVNQFSIWGIKNVCISPGSRNTPLTMAFAGNKSFKKVVLADERSSGFFALGIAKDLKKPVVIVTTSGTAVAELYPAIIEAYYQRVPLIVCTADRPEFLRDTGANQTINQNNIFKNHIRYFKDIGLPNLSRSKIINYISSVTKSLDVALNIDPGPVHLNFPFKKPLEPNSFSDNIVFKLSDFLTLPKQTAAVKKSVDLSGLVNAFNEAERPVIHCGWDNYGKEFYKNLAGFSVKHKIPVFADGASGIRFTRYNKSSVFTNYASFIELMRSEPDLILQFGNAPTSRQMLDYISKSRAKRFLVNSYGDIKDPSPKKGILIKEDPEKVLQELSLELKNQNWANWIKYLIKLESYCNKCKTMITDSKFGSEPGIIDTILSAIPRNSNIFISNSLPIRDFDYFASKWSKNFNIYSNRGASGIDGIISTASGIAWNSSRNTFLLIGDLAFYHNLTALSTLHQLKIPLKIILINNGGGNIFRMLPISEKNELFEDYFLTPQNLNYGKLTKAFNGKYFLTKSGKSFKDNLHKISELPIFSVTEVLTDAENSVKLRRKFWKTLKETIRNNEN